MLQDQAEAGRAGRRAPAAARSGRSRHRRPAGRAGAGAASGWARPAPPRGWWPWPTSCSAVRLRVSPAAASRAAPAPAFRAAGRVLADPDGRRGAVAPAVRGPASRTSSCSGTRRCCRCSGITGARAIAIVVSEARDGQYLADFAAVARLPGGARLEHARRRPRPARRGARAPGGLRGGVHARRPARAAAGAQARRGGGGAARAAAIIVPLHAEAEPGVAVRFVGPIHDPQTRRPGADHATAARSRWARARPGLAARTGARRRHDWRRSWGARHEPPGRHPPGDALAVDQPAAGRAAGAAGAAAGRPASGAAAWTRASWPTAAGGWRSATCRCPSVAVGNLTVGGSGKTPIAIWIARHYVGARPPARDPAARLRQRRDAGAPARGARGAWSSPIRTGPPAPSARWPTARRCWCWTTPISGSTSAATSTSLVVSAETTRAVRWPLPAGPWREGLGGARPGRRGDRHPEAGHAGGRRWRWPPSWRTGSTGPVAIAHLGLRHARRAGRAAPVGPADTLAGKRVVAASGIADPDAFVAQTKATGAAVQVATWKDHHDYRDEDVAWLAHAARRADHVVITQKDAVKLRDRWPAACPSRWWPCWT